MIDRLMRQGGTLYLLLAGYFILHIVVRLALPSSLELDEGQQLFFSQWLKFGYDSQPPFYNWLQYGAVHVFGVSVAALTVLKNLLLFGATLLLGLTANLILRDKALAAVATLGLIAIPQVSFEAQRDLTHTVAVLFAACLFLYAFVNTLQRPTAWTYSLTGLAAGIGVLAKYNFMLLPLAAIVAVLPDRDFRARLFDWRILLTIAIGAVVVLPHAWWFFEHVDIATERTLGKLIERQGSRLERITDGLGALAVAIVAFGFTPLLVFWIAFGRRLATAWKASSPMSRLLGRMFIAIVVMLTALVLFAGATDIRPRWLVPFFFPLPLWLCLKIEASDGTTDTAPRRFGRITVSIMILVLLVLAARTPVMGMLGRYERPNVPYDPAIKAILASGQDRPSLVAAIDQQMAGNIRLQAADIPIIVPGFKHLQPVYPFDTGHPVLLVWRDRGNAVPELPPELSAWLLAQPALAALTPETHDIALPYHYGRAGDVYHFSYAWLYPVPVSK